MSDIDVLRVPEKKPEKTELASWTHRSWWCRKFHDSHMLTVGHTYVGKSFRPIRVCRKCYNLDRSM
jgi:hypothetical protein